MPVFYRRSRAGGNTQIAACAPKFG